MKKILSVIISVLAVFSTSVCLAEDNGNTKIELNGEMKHLVAYNIEGNNYFKLRDIAILLKDTEKKFDVEWNEGKRAIIITSGKEYSTDEELTKDVLKNVMAKYNAPDIVKDGATILLNAYSIKDNNYFKLRDVAMALNFNVSWDENEKIIKLDTNMEYEYENSDEFGLNPMYFSFIGKTKKEIEKLVGEGEYSTENGTTDYKIGLIVGWDSEGEPTDESRAVSVFVRLFEAFYNCPDHIPSDDLKNEFVASYEEDSEIFKEKVLTVNYCGKKVLFFPDRGLGKNCYCILSILNDYPYETEKLYHI